MKIKNMKKRMLNFVLTFVIVVSMLPMTVYAAATEAMKLGEEIKYISYNNNAVQYFSYNNYLFKITYKNLHSRIGEVSIGLTERGYGTDDNDYYLCLLAKGQDEECLLWHSSYERTYALGDLPILDNPTITCYSNSYDFTNSENSEYVEVAEITRVEELNEPIWTWDGTSSAIATFTTNNRDNISVTTPATIESTIISTAVNCQEKDQIKYIAYATLNRKRYSDTKIVDGTTGSHNYIYSANEKADTITESCSNGCGYEATAQLVLDETVSRKYTGSSIEPLKIDKSANWVGDITLTYENNVNVSTEAVGKLSVNNVEPQVAVAKSFEIEKGDMNITASGYTGTYDNAEHGITVTAPDGATIQYKTDENGEWSPTNPTFKTVGTYNVFYKITKDNYNDVTGLANVIISPIDMSAEITATDYNGTYDGEPHCITVSAPEGATVKYRLSETADWSENNPTFNNTGIYNVFYKVTKENYKEVTGSATVTIDKIIPTADMFTFTTPTNLVYDGNVKEASVVKTDNEDVGTITLRYYDSKGTMYISAPKDAGTYTVKILVGGNDFYYATEEPIYPTDGISWTFTIEQKKVNYTWGERTLKYTGGKLVPTATVVEAELVKGDICTLTVVSAETYEGACIIPGNYHAVIDDWSNKNYTLSSECEVFTSYEIIDADQAKPVLISTNETIDGKNDGAISGLTTAMEYRKASEGNYTVITAEMLNNGTLENLSDGNYYVRYAEKQYYDASPETEVIIYAGNKLNVTIPETQNGYTLTVDKTEVAWNESATLTFALENGYSKTDSFAVKVNNTHITLDADGKYAIANIQENQTITVEGVADITAPTATIIVATKEWKDFINDITFGIFFKATQEVTITANDIGSGLDKVYYHLSSEELTEDTIKALGDWTEYTEAFNINPDKKYVIYAKAVDEAGNTVYINSDGLVLDATAPEITGITNGGTYYGNTEFGVTESYLDTVTLDEIEITLTNGKYTITADDKEHIIIATDKATNSNATMTIKVVAISSLDNAIENITTSTVKSTDKEAIQDVLELVKSLQDSGKDFTDSEDTKLAEIKSNAETLLNRIQKAEGAVDNELTGKVYNINSGNVNVSDKEDLEDAKAALEQALQNYPDNYTKSEKDAIKADIQRINDAIKSIEKVEDTTSKITNLPPNVEPDDLETVDKIEAAKAVYNALTDHEKSLVSAEDMEKLDSLLAQSIDYKIVEGNGASIREDSHNTLRFKVNGAYSKFTGIKVNDNLIDASRYTSESGSTIIALKNEFLDELSVGTHSLTVMYTDGEATGNFTITAKQAPPAEDNEDTEDTENSEGASSETPPTGDNTNIAIYFTTLLLAGIGLILLVVTTRRKRN